MLAIKNIILVFVVFCWKTYKKFQQKDFGWSKSVFGFRVLLGNPKSEIQNRNPDFPIERTLYVLLKSLFMNISRKIAIIRHTSCIRFK